VAYDYARKFNVDIVQNMIDSGSGIAEFRENVSDVVFDKILNGLYDSKRTPIDIKKYCKKHTPN